MLLPEKMRKLKSKFILIIILFVLGCAVTEKSTGAVSNFIGQIRETKGTIETDLIRATIDHITDGDTIAVILDGSVQKVRLIGIDTPESVHPDESRNNDYGEMASAYTKELLDGVTDVYLQYDEDPTDRYGRLLAYVWISADTSDLNNMLNYAIVYNGYAFAKAYPPNTSHSDDFSAACKDAENNKRGLWQYEGFANLWN